MNFSPRADDAVRLHPARSPRESYPGPRMDFPSPSTGQNGATHLRTSMSPFNKRSVSRFGFTLDDLEQNGVGFSGPQFSGNYMDSISLDATRLGVQIPQRQTGESVQRTFPNGLSGHSGGGGGFNGHLENDMSGGGGSSIPRGMRNDFDDNSSLVPVGLTEMDSRIPDSMNPQSSLLHHTPRSNTAASHFDHQGRPSNATGGPTTPHAVGAVGGSATLQHLHGRVADESVLFKLLERSEPPPLPSLDQINPQQQQQQRHSSHLQLSHLDSSQLLFQQVMSQQQNVPPHVIHTQARTPRDSSQPMYIPANNRVFSTQAPHQQPTSAFSSTPLTPTAQAGSIHGGHPSHYHPPPNLPHPVYTTPSPTNQGTYVPPQQQQPLPGHMSGTGGSQSRHSQLLHDQQSRQDGLGRYMNSSASSGFQREKELRGGAITPQMQNLPHAYVGEVERKFGSLSVRGP
eukprot:TRINITY_DN4827_c0_g1_i1.p1 TRINITY_DN4827_c0_g1~~TRINITY_DN4827_c0_g1_i1.p1  ORF type:complete len:457 (+),score=89.28 TRINITY_DN4827_c0_g1_i1:242-1612(+)